MQIIRKLVSEDFVNFQGKHYTLRDANLYMKASFPIFLGASGPRWQKWSEKSQTAFSRSRGRSTQETNSFPRSKRERERLGRDPKEIVRAIEIDLSYDSDLDRALVPLRTQAGPLLPKMFTDPIYDPREIEKEGQQVTDEELAKAYVLGSTPEDFIRPIEAAFNAGFDHVYLASLSPDEKSFIRMCGEKILPYFAERKKPSA